MKTEHILGAAAGGFLLWKLFGDGAGSPAPAANRRRGRLASNPSSAGGLIVTGEQLRQIGMGFVRTPTTDEPDQDAPGETLGLPPARSFPGQVVKFDKRASRARVAWASGAYLKDRSHAYGVEPTFDGLAFVSYGERPSGLRSPLTPGEAEHVAWRPYGDTGAGSALADELSWLLPATPTTELAGGRPELMRTGFYFRNRTRAGVVDLPYVRAGVRGPGFDASKQHDYAPRPGDVVLPWLHYDERALLYASPAGLAAWSIDGARRVEIRPYLWDQATGRRYYLDAEPSQGYPRGPTLDGGDPIDRILARYGDNPGNVPRSLRAESYLGPAEPTGSVPVAVGVNQQLAPLWRRLRELTYLRALRPCRWAWQSLKLPLNSGWAPMKLVTYTDAPEVLAARRDIDRKMGRAAR